jgi:UDP-N-acetyl-D-mannosaminuronic acid dehydrogenase
MPLHMVDLTVQALQQAGVAIQQARVAVLGFAYLENSDDTRHSPSETAVARLRELGAAVQIHDPWVPEYQGDVLECVRGCDAVLVMVAHQAYQTLDWAALRVALRCPLLIDGRHVFSAAQAQSAGLHYRGVGQG